MADTGTLFLDEVGDIPLALQPKLLRVLQEREFERLGSGRTHHVDVRLVAATHRDLEQMVKQNAFRRDLFYRLNVFPIQLPALRERREDIVPLVMHYVKLFAGRMGKHIEHIPAETLATFESYSWPGNIRELQNIVERSVILSRGDTLWIEKAWLASEQPLKQELAGALPDTLQNQEKRMIEAALAESKGKISGPDGAAVKLGIPRSTLDSKIKLLNIKKHKLCL
jgi:formate hydrogenlyase transcriptional activator